MIPCKHQLVALHLWQRLAIYQLPPHLEVAVDLDDQHLAEVAFEVQRDRVVALERGDASRFIIGSGLCNFFPC